jgi:DNA polymerase I-like protein with 3'-5' exonuclease and polymerase domains
MPSAHPRLLADFTQNETFINAVDGKEERTVNGEDVYEGEDIHTVNSVIFELNSEMSLQECRDTQSHGELRRQVDLARGASKAPFYCILYGGSAKKLVLILGCDENKAEELKSSFLATFGLDELLEEVGRTWRDQKRGNGSYISVLGGYHAWSNSKHKIINYKALGSEAVVQKVAVTMLCRELRDKNLKSKLVLNIHDEVLLEVPDEEVELVKPLAANMYVVAAKELGLTLDWTSTAKVGVNYAVCH